MVGNGAMFWLAWIGWAVVFAALFSIVKMLDRLNHSVALVDARLAHLSGRLAEVVATLNTTDRHVEPGSVPDSLLEFANELPSVPRVSMKAEPRGPKKREHSSEH
jgi:hypothetical protein